MKNFLIAVALMTFAATNAQAQSGRWHGHGHHGHHGGGHHGGAPLLFFGALAALSIPFFYAQRSHAVPYAYYDAAPPTNVYVPRAPVAVANQPGYAIAAAPPGVTPPPYNGVIELGPVDALPPMESNPAPNSEQQSGQAGEWFVYPGRGQNPQQLANDRYDCSRWATHASGYDPDLRTHRNPETGPVAYGRALTACLEGRGYAVR